MLNEFSSTKEIGTLGLKFCIKQRLKGVKESEILNLIFLYQQFSLNFILPLDTSLSVVVRPELMARKFFVHCVLKKILYSRQDKLAIMPQYSLLLNIIIIFLVRTFKIAFSKLYCKRIIYPSLRQ